MTRRNIGLFVVTTAVMVGCMPDYSVPRLGRSSDSDDDSSDPFGEDPNADGTGGPGGAGTSPSFPPVFGATVRQAEAPPPLSGGTMSVAADGVTVVAADPDRDRVYLLDFRTASSLRTVMLAPHDEPGRVVIDAANRAHVALRSGGAVVTIDIATATILSRRDVCAAPRGIAYEPATDVVHVACAGGELVAMPAAGGAEVKRRMITRDLRDVVVVQGGLTLSTFREAALLRLEADSDIVIEQPSPTLLSFGRPRVAWRMIAAPPPAGDEAEVMVAGQKAPEDGPDVPVPPAPAAYYGQENTTKDPCSANGPGPVIRDRNESLHVPDAVLPVDVAATREWMVVVAAGNGHTPGKPQLLFVRRAAAVRSTQTFACDGGHPTYAPNAQLTSVSFAQNGTKVVALSREPAALLVVDAETHQEVSRIALAVESREDTGHAIFHSNSGVGLACASCHPDGRDDGHSWRSVELGPRRTSSLLGTVANTAPYHWNGEAKDMRALAQLTFQTRMSGPLLAADQTDAMDGWLRALRAPILSKPTDAAAVSRGKAAFEGAATCSSCHSGPMRTSNASVDVQTGGTFQVPSLIGVSWRAPHLHDGSAPSVKALLERGHGGGKRPAAQISDLVSFVNTL